MPGFRSRTCESVSLNGLLTTVLTRPRLRPRFWNTALHSLQTSTAFSPLRNRAGRGQFVPWPISQLASSPHRARQSRRREANRERQVREGKKVTNVRSPWAPVTWRCFRSSCGGGIRRIRAPLTMASVTKIAANRRNAAKSTGPRSAAAKRRTRRNAERHGLATRIVFNADQLLRIDAMAASL